MTIIDRVVYLLKDNRLKQADLCKYLDIQYNVFTTWKTRGTDPPAKYIIQICAFLNVSPYYLLTGKEKSPSQNTDEHERELLNCYRKLSDFDKGEVLGDIKRRVANVNIEQVKKPNIQKVYQAARTYDHKPVSSVIEADITPLLEAPDATDEY